MAVRRDAHTAAVVEQFNGQRARRVLAGDGTRFDAGAFTPV
jgi:hypothetical protein